MAKNPFFSVVFLVLVFWQVSASARVASVTVRLTSSGDAEEVVTRENLISIKRFVFEVGELEFASSRYGPVPTVHTDRFVYSLVPFDPFSALAKPQDGSDYGELRIRRPGHRDQYRYIDFEQPKSIYVRAPNPDGGLSVFEVSQFVREAILEVLDLVKHRPSKAIDHGE